MVTEHVTCACCGQLMVLEQSELAFKLPDDLAALDQAALAERSKCSDDFCVLDLQRFFVRCVIPLPIQLNDGVYAIGAWAEVKSDVFSRILALWQDEKQGSAAPFNATLANQVPLNNNTLGCSIVVQMTDLEKRPSILIQDANCSLYAEQQQGISAHRVLAYATVYLPKSQYTVLEQQALSTTTCPCCGHAIKNYQGQVLQQQRSVAQYWLNLPEGHDGYFMVAIALHITQPVKIIVLLGEATEDGLSYTIKNKANSPWGELAEYGKILDRQEALQDADKTLFFAIVDAIAAQDSRLCAHVEPYLGE